ncbi:hypothetical protein GP475_08925 [Corynebacterium poyangense]|uniref:Uncharacterized protein n=1 Tax=Corynebacterium poyangense TaxID=2684405 RepID=A0A7H0SQC4_9CORY|nr:hypothetical protein [Corynebacterium poyangense]QNQ90749.1 hypothetical protein GP475_08925 [Corynebacterium poyangense]
MESQPMYRVHVISEPEFVEYTAIVMKGDRAEEVEALRPIGWTPSEDYCKRFGTTKWLRPNPNKWFKSRSSAHVRLKILRDAGYEAVIQESAPVQWPCGDTAKILPAQEIKEAAAVLIRHGVIDSMADLFRE